MRDGHRRLTVLRSSRFRAGVLACLCFVAGDGRRILAQEPSAPRPVSAEELRDAITKLGDLDYATRTGASQTVRRTPGAQAVPALLDAVATHADGYVRYRALVLLTGFNDPRTKDAMREALASPNDRLRTVAYRFFEHNRDLAMVPVLLEALEKERAEFVRPALTRALAAYGGEDERVRLVLTRESGRGEDFFRSTVIEALGDYRAQYALDAVTEVAKLDGPLQDDAALALGKIGDKRALVTLASLQSSAPRQRQPSIAAAICLLGVNCESHEHFLVETLKFADVNPGFQELLRGAAAGLGALGVIGRASATEALFAVGIPSVDPARAPVALAVATVALRNTRSMLDVLANQAKQDEAILLMAEGFDILEEDYEKERFFALVRQTYWKSPEDSPTRRLMQSLIGTLDF
jgi:HEAT repeat protein